ncbi:MAG: transcriptional repressor [Actinobacteria bacterium]|nr:transcriptional repressor [Actinomycetota bacterium]
MGSQLHRTVEQRLRRARSRYTRGRRQLVDLLADAGRPVTIGELLDGGSGLSQSSVYRNLQVLEQAGAVRRLVTATDPGARFELAEDLTSHHHHLICNVCGGIEDLQPSAPIERAVARLTSELAAADRFATEHHRLDLVGTCADCR